MVRRSLAAMIVLTVAVAVYIVSSDDTAEADWREQSLAPLRVRGLAAGRAPMPT